jgi:hypothetical protein
MKSRSINSSGIRRSMQKVAIMTSAVLRISDVRQIQNILYPNNDQYNPAVRYNRTSDFYRIKALQLKTAQDLAAKTNIPAGRC